MNNGLITCVVFAFVTVSRQKCTTELSTVQNKMFFWYLETFHVCGMLISGCSDFVQLIKLPFAQALDQTGKTEITSSLEHCCFHAAPCAPIIPENVM